MYIKQVIIQGFRSYRDQTVVEPFSPRHNVVVGRNGSGKSNFFYAIQFVLSDEFSHLQAEARQALLHEGTGPRSLSAFVEIIFDNTDNRLPIDKDEVVLRRMVGAKKDQYFLDKKLVTRTDIMNLLESAGFSRSNPYYIVKQGKIIEMATARDAQRLKLLKEVAGTKVYDERKEESTKILQETESRRDKIEETLKYIEERLATLESEKDELKEYQKWDRMRRSLDYTIHDHELKDVRKKLDEIQERRDNSGAQTVKLRGRQEEAATKAQEASKQLRELRSKHQTLIDEKELLNTEHQELIKDKAKAELGIKDIQDELESERNTKKGAEDELRKLHEKIAVVEKDLAAIAPRHQAELDREQKALTQLAQAEQRRKELFAKQGRGSQFHSKEQRDGWIDKEVGKLKRNIDEKKDQIAKLKADLVSDSGKREKLESSIAEITASLDSQKDIIDQKNKSCGESKKQKDVLANERNDLWRAENSLQQALTTTRDELYKEEQALRSITGRAVLNGIDSVQKVLKSLANSGRNAEVNGYYGLLIENFECEEAFHTSVEVTAGSRLFFHLVDTDTTSTALLSEMNRLKLPGEVSFMPLNRLDVSPTQYPDSTDAVPMVSKLKYKAKFEKAFQHVFGKTLICRNMETASQFARTLNLDCITLEGDQVSRRGALTGGYYGNRRSRLHLQKTKAELARRLEQQEAEYASHKAKLVDVEGRINKVVAEMQRMETQNSKNKDTFDKMKQDLRLMKEDLERLNKDRAPKERSLNTMESSLETMTGSLQGLMAERGTDLQSHLSREDQKELENLTETIQRLTAETKQSLRERTKLETEKNQLENKLSNNLRKKQDSLQKELEDISVADRGSRMETLQAELTVLSQRINENRNRLKEVDRQIDNILTDQKSRQQDLEKWKSEELDYQEKIREDAKELEKMMTKQSLLLKKRDEAMKKIRELGSLPTEAFEKYKDLNMKQLFNKLEHCNRELKKYSHVNKKALDQFMSFSDQKEKLITRKEELDKAYKSIEDLMQALDHRKYEAIQLTFKQVSKYFTEIFQKLVPQGHGVLVMKRGEPEPAAEGETQEDNNEAAAAAARDDDADGQNVPVIMQFTGVGIKVSFTGNRGEMRDMQQLSGGQKSLVALGLIFAIQKCDPAPFYLFDEIDQALDAQHRKAVADMIHELSGDAQFITTTFRPELLEHADKFYGVVFRNKVSHIQCVSKEEAQDFVEDDAQHG